MSTQHSVRLRGIVAGTLLAFTAACFIGFAPATSVFAQEVVSIDAGGATVSNTGGGDNSFVADQDYTGGSTYSVTNTITIPASVSETAAPAEVYQAARQGVSTYTIPGLTAGSSYNVRLHFAELYFSAAGGRKFNVAINGTTVLTNFDIYATAGGKDTAVVEQYATTPNSGGDIVITFTNGTVDQPMVNGIEVLGTSTACSAVPPTPANFTATATSSSSIGLSWTAVNPPANCTISSYNVYGGTTANPTTLIASVTSGTTYSNTGLAASTLYYYTVKAVDADGTSTAATAQTTTLANTSCTAVPSAPSGLTATTSSSSAIALSWTAVTPPANCTISSYTVYGGTAANPTTVIASGLAGTTFNNTGLAASTKYYYMVKAIDADGTSAASNQATQTTEAVSSGSSVVSIDTGGSAVSDSGGGDNSFIADEGYTGGGTYSVTNTITIPSSVSATAAPATVYQSARQGAATYTIPGLTGGASYNVRLHFAELYFSAAGGREFNVTINGTTVLTNFDIYAAAGAKDTAVVKQFTATANSSGEVVIAFTNGALDQPMVNGIEVLSTSTGCSVVPPTPTDFAATALSSSTIGLSWNAVTPPVNCTISSYSVYGGTTANPTTLLATVTSGTTYTSTGLAASTLYYYAVKSVDADGASTAAVTQTTTLAVASTGYVSIDVGGAAVTNSAGGDNSFVADEDYSTGGTTYSVTNNITIPAAVSATAAPAAVYQSARQGVVTYTIPGLTAGTSYFVRLHFAELYFAATGNREFNVAINGATVLTNFDIFATAGASYAAVVEQYTVTANSSGNIVIAFTDGAANQPMINGIEVLDSIPCTTLPSAPLGLTANATYPSVIALTWNAVTPPANCAISSYTVYGGTSANPTTVIATGVRGPSYTGTGLNASTKYYYAVEAVDAYGASAASQTASTTTPAYTPIAPPTSLTAVGSSYQQIDLRWVASTAPAPNTAPVNYAIYRSTTTPFTPSAANLIGTTVGITNYVDSNYPATLTEGDSSIPPGPGVQPSTTYHYQVVASTLSGISSAANAAATSLPATSSPTAPVALTGLTAMAQNANEIDLIWNSTNSGVGAVATTYYIYRSVTSPFTPAMSNLIGTTKSNWFQDALCTASSKYYYQVLASNTIGVSPSGITVTATTPALNTSLWGGAPFWDASNIPALPAGDTLMVKFLNRTNGKYTDGQIIYTATINGNTVNSTIAENPTFAMGANSSGRMYFFLNDPTVDEDNADYWDYIEFTVGPTSINMDTTRVDALGVKIAFNLSCSDGTNVALGENEQTFMEDRSVTFQRYLAAAPYNLDGSVPYDFRADETAYAPYRIIEPGGAGFNAGGPYQNYYADYISSIWSFNGITIPQATSNGAGLGDNPDLSAAIFRHTAPISGTPEFNSAGALTNQGMWGNPASFYQREPYDHYAQWIEAQAINMQQYAFPYNDAGGYSSDIGCANPKTLLVAIGW